MPNGLHHLIPAGRPDSVVANQFLPAHADRWCHPGDPIPECRRLRYPRPIRQIVIHVRTSRGANPIQRWQNQPQRGEARTTPHYYVDRAGRITQLVREADVARHAENHNRDTIGIEHGDVGNNPTAYTEALYEQSAALIRDIVARHRLVIDRATVIGHELLNHGHHDDPGAYWDWEYYFRLLIWNGRAEDERPIRIVATLPAVAIPGWQVQHRRRIPDDMCATSHDP